MTEYREATEADVERVRDLFLRAYGKNFFYPGFYDTAWLKKAVFSDETVFYVAETNGEIVATASAMLSVGGMSDLLCEVGRLVAENSKRGRAAVLELCRALVESIRTRVLFTFAEVRTLHAGSQRIAEALDWRPVGFAPLVHQLARRESAMLYARLENYAAELRRNNPRLIPEIARLAQTALHNLGLPRDTIIEDEPDGYPTGQPFALERLRETGVTSLLRIERGRVSHREIFGHFSLSHGFFRIADSNSHYLVAKDGEAVLGAVGFTYDPIDGKIRIFELIEFDDAVKGWLLASVDRLAAEEFGALYQEVDISAYAPKMQRTFERLGFVPVAYCPAMVFDNVERLDVVRMAKINMRYDLGPQKLLENGRRMRAIVEQGLEDRMIGLEVAEASRHCEIFHDLPDGERHHLARIAAMENRPAGTRLIRRGDAPDRLYILVEGRAEARREAAVLGRLGPGAIFGEMGLVERAPRSADVVLVTDARFVVIEIPRLERLMEQRPRLGYVVARNLARSVSGKLRHAGDDPSGD